MQSGPVHNSCMLEYRVTIRTDPPFGAGPSPDPRYSHHCVYHVFDTRRSAEAAKRAYIVELNSRAGGGETICTQTHKQVVTRVGDRWCSVYWVANYREDMEWLRERVGWVPDLHFREVCPFVVYPHTYILNLPLPDVVEPLTYLHISALDLK